MRLPLLQYDDLSDSARRVWNAVVTGRRGPSETVTSDGGLAGPFNAMLYTPSIGLSYAALGEAIRFDAVLDDRRRELATITVSAYWRSDFEWSIHSELALLAGISQKAIDAIGRGEDPSFSDPRDVVTHRFVRELVRTGQVDDVTYSTARELLGDVAVVELVVTVGYYCLISLTLNALRVPADDSPTLPWPSPASLHE